MRSTLSTKFLRGIFAQETGICPVFLVTIEHPDLTQPICLSSDPTQRISEPIENVVYGTKSRGIDYVFFPFSLVLPIDAEDGEQSITFTFDNVTRKYVETIRTVTGKPIVNVEMVLAETPDVVETTWPEFELNEAEFDVQTISATLALDTLYQEPFPYGTFCPSYFPGLF